MSDPSWTDIATAIGTSVAAVATVVTAIVAVFVAATWQRNLRQATKHETAANVLEQARLFRYLFYDARNPLYLGAEFPPQYHTISGARRYPSQEAEGWAFVYENRWKPLGEQMLKLAALRARAGAVLGDETAQALEELARKGRELQNMMANRVEQWRAGPNTVAQWPDQDWVKKVRRAVETEDPQKPDDPYSLEFEAKFRALEEKVSPYI